MSKIDWEQDILVKNLIDSLWPSDAIWRRWSWSVLVTFGVWHQAIEFQFLLTQWCGTVPWPVLLLIITYCIFRNAREAEFNVLSPTDSLQFHGDLFNTDSDNGLLCDGTKPLHEAVLILTSNKPYLVWRQLTVRPQKPRLDIFLWKCFGKHKHFSVSTWKLHIIEWPLNQFRLLYYLTLYRISVP